MRRGFTLIESIVVIAITAVLLSLVCGAVAKVRRAAASAAALNALRQVNLQVIEVFDLRNGKCPSNFPAYYQIGDSLGVEHRYRLESNRPGNCAEYMGSRFFESPADPSLSYYPPVGRFGARGNSSFCYNALIVLSDRVYPECIPDGASNTILNSEHYARCGEGNGWTDFVWSLFDSKGSGPRRASFADKGYGDLLPVAGQPLPTETFQPAPFPPDCDSRRLQSSHKQGLLIALADGSARRMSTTVKGNVFWALITPDGGEVTTDE